MNAILVNSSCSLASICIKALSSREHASRCYDQVQAEAGEKPELHRVARETTRTTDDGFQDSFFFCQSLLVFILGI